MSLFVLDTDTYSLFERGHPTVVTRCLAQPPTDRTVTVITVEEILSGWYRRVRQAKQRAQVARAYLRLAEAIPRLSGWRILPYPEPAIARFEQFRRSRLQVGSNDLRIAAIVLEYSGTLVIRNLRDFQRVPNLNCEDWSV